MELGGCRTSKHLAMNRRNCNAHEALTVACGNILATSSRRSSTSIARPPPHRGHRRKGRHRRPRSSQRLHARAGAGRPPAHGGEPHGQHECAPAAGLACEPEQLAGGEVRALPAPLPGRLHAVAGIRLDETVGDRVVADPAQDAEVADHDGRALPCGLCANPLLDLAARQ